MRNPSRNLLVWVPVILWAAVIFCLSSMTGAQIPGVPIPSADKLAHIGVYGVFGLLCFRALRSTTRLGPTSLILVGTAMALGYGISDEVHQLFVPGRASELGDLVADLVGGALGCLAASRIFRGSRAGAQR